MQGLCHAKQRCPVGSQMCGTGVQGRELGQRCQSEVVRFRGFDEWEQKSLLRQSVRQQGWAGTEPQPPRPGPKRRRKARRRSEELAGVWLDAGVAVQGRPEAAV